MRLKVEVHRHKLPTTSILWQADPHQTISAFLQAIDVIIPLQSEDWALDDYIVQDFNGFEALHFSNIGHVLKDEDFIRYNVLLSINPILEF